MSKGKTIHAHLIPKYLVTFKERVLCIPEDSGMQILIAGSYRRGVDLCNDIDLVCIPAKVDDNMFKHISSRLGMEFGWQKNGKAKMRGLFNGISWDVHLAMKNSAGAMILYSTGSYKFNIMLRRKAASRKMKLNRYGLYYRCSDELVVPGATEGGILNALDALSYLEPTSREV